MSLSDKRSSVCTVVLVNMSGGLKEGREEGKTQLQVVSSYIVSCNPYNIPGKRRFLSHFKNEKNGGSVSNIPNVK